jgi:hypothetical protein
VAPVQLCQHFKQQKFYNICHLFNQVAVEFEQDRLGVVVDLLRQDGDSLHRLVADGHVQPQSRRLVHLEDVPDFGATGRRCENEKGRDGSAEMSLLPAL